MADDDKFAFKDPASLVVQEEKKVWRAQAFQGVSPFDFAMKQKLQEKERKEKERMAKIKAAMERQEREDAQAEALMAMDERKRP